MFTSTPICLALW